MSAWSCFEESLPIPAAGFAQGVVGTRAEIPDESIPGSRVETAVNSGFAVRTATVGRVNTTLASGGSPL